MFRYPCAPTILPSFDTVVRPVRRRIYSFLCSRVQIGDHEGWSIDLTMTRHMSRPVQLKAFMCLLIASLSHAVMAQPAVVDSIVRVLRSTTIDTQRVRCMVRLSVHMRYEDIDRGVAFADSAIVLARNTNDLNGLYHAYTAKANALLILVTQGTGPWSDDSVIVLHENALRIAAEMGDTLGMSIAHFNLGSVYTSRNPFLGLQHSLEGFNLQREPNDLAQHRCYATMADCYDRLGQQEESINYGKLAVEAADRSGKKSIRVMSRMVLAEALIDHGKEDSALIVFKEIGGISDSRHAVGGMWCGIASARRAQGDVGGCLRALDSAIVIYDPASKYHAMRWLHAVRAEALSSLGRLVEARREIRSHDLVTDEYLEPSDMSETYLNLSKAYLH